MWRQKVRRIRSKPKRLKSLGRRRERERERERDQGIRVKKTMGDREAVSKNSEVITRVK